ncbi:MAG: DivIVA domain-containing protein [Fimbriimonas sp.]|nr:DivIVA domain-containing protein [Fimbriimonas sp.]
MERAKLRKSFRGYDKVQVETLLAGAADSLKQLLVDNATLREQVERQYQDLERTKLAENTLKDALILAQKAADETRAAAHQHAEAILEEARQSALAERVAVQQQMSEMRWDMERLKGEKKRFEEEFRSILERYQRDLSVSPIFRVVEGDVAAVGN